MIRIMLLALTITMLSAISLFSQSNTRNGATGSTKVYNLSDCLQIATQSNFDMQGAMAQLPAAEADKKAAFGAYLPQVNANAGYSRRLNELGGGQFNIGGFRAPADQFSLSSTANILLFNGFARESQIQASGANYTALEQTIQQTKQQVSLTIHQRYITVLRNAQVVNIRKQNLELGLKELDRVKARYDAGAAPIALVYAQEADNGQRELELVQAENLVNIAKADLLSSMAKSPHEKAEFSENSFPKEITDSDIINFRDKVNSLEEAFKKALMQRSDLASANSRINAAQHLLSGSKSGYYPTISASGGWSWFNSQLSDFDLFSRTFIGLNLDIPVFDAFQTNQRVENAQLQMRQREIEKERVEQSIRNQLQNGLLNLYSAEKQLEITVRTVKSAEQNFKSAKERFEVGTAGIIDYQTANAQLVNATINRLNAVYNYLDAQVQVRFALGDL